MKRKNGDTRQNPSFVPEQGQKRPMVLGDSKLTTRVKQYLEKNKHKQVICVSSMAEELQSTYSRDYGRRKKIAFKNLVERAYNSVRADLQNSSLEGDTYNQQETAHLAKKQPYLVISDSGDSDSDGEKSFSSDNPDYVEYKDQNAMNSVLSNMYKKQPLTPIRKGENSRENTPDRESTEASSSRNSGSQRTQQKHDRPGFFVDRKPSSAVKLKSFSQQMSNNTGENVAPDDASSIVVKTNTPTKQQQNQNAETHKDSCVTGSEPVVETGNNDNQTASKSKKDKSSKKNTKSANKRAGERDEKKSPKLISSTVRFCDIGGNDSTLKEVCKLLVHMKHPEVYERLGVTPPRGFLLHGPPGCGKTLMAHAIAGELELPYLKVAATELVSGVSGDSEEKIRDMFEIACASAPCVMFMDEIDAITPKRETASKDMERRIVSQLLTCMDDLSSNPRGHVLVIGATNRPDSLDPALRRAGRFDREIALGIPDEDARGRILKVLCRELRLEPGFDFLFLARNSPGYVGADLMALTREAAIVAVNRVFNDLQKDQTMPRPITSHDDTCTVGSSEPMDVSQEITTPTVSSQDDSLPQTLTHVSQTTPHSFPDVQVPTKNALLPNNESSNSDSLSLNKDQSIERDSRLISGTSQNTSESPLHNKDGEMRLEPVVVKSSESEHEYHSVLTWLKDQPPLTGDQLDSLFITMDDFKLALQHVQPSAKREGFATIPDVTWEDIGALKEVREELQMAIMGPVRHPEQFKALGLVNPPGILLAGPPGCGKTLLAKAVANESGINFISVKGPELLNMYVGESERAVRQVFQRARNSTPCVIFFDELDALCPRRSGSGEGGASVRVVNQLLTEMDGLEARKQVFIMGATNRPDIIDPAILRPGRLDKLLYVGLPSEDDRHDILRTLTKDGTKPVLSADVCLRTVAQDPACQGFTGADLAALVREASVAALREFMSQSNPSAQSAAVSRSHFQHALTKVRPSVTEKDKELYRRMRDRISTS